MERISGLMKPEQPASIAARKADSSSDAVTMTTFVLTPRTFAVACAPLPWERW